MEKYGRAKQTTHDNIIQYACIAWWIMKSTDTHSVYVILIAFPTATVVMQTHLSVMFLRTLHVLFMYKYC